MKDNMWNDNNSKINKILFNLKNADFPEKCPICGENTYHMYMHRFEEKNSHGSGWVWCSSCQNYSHYQYLIPENWNNLPCINVEMLEDEPEYLENNKDMIDSWVNQQLKK